MTRLAGSTPACWPFVADLDRLSWTETLKANLNERRWRHARAGTGGAAFVP
jgi:hypothetical protein